METIILKLGGSVITHKDNNELKAKTDVIRRIAKEIKAARKDNEFSLIVVHGAGPFGHKLVTDYKIKDGLDSGKDIEGFVRTHNSMEDLNKIIMDIFRAEGLLGFPVQPSACIIQNNKKIERFNTEIVKELLNLDNRIIPILYGDMVIDKALKASVVSGDAIITYLAREFEVSRILMGTDVKGIFSEDPKINPHAEFIEKIDNSNFDKVLEKVTGANTVDVTGGMKQKLIELKENLSGIKIVIFNAAEENNVYRVLTGQNIGTTIEI